MFLQSLGKEKAFYFRSTEKTLVYKNRKELIEDKQYDREITCDILAIRNDGERFDGKLRIQLTGPQSDGGWRGMCKVQIVNESVTFECSRVSLVSHSSYKKRGNFLTIDKILFVMDMDQLASGL